MASDVTPTETSPSSFTPSVISSSTSLARFSPSTRKVKSRLGIWARLPSEADRNVAKSGSQTSPVKLLPPTSGQESAKHRGEPEPSHNYTESVLLHKIQQLEHESQKLRESCARLEQELSNNSSQLSSSNQQKEAAQRERDLERNNKVGVLTMLEEQKATLDEYRSNFELQKMMLDEVEKERYAEWASKAELHVKLEESKQALDGFKCTYELQKVLLTEVERERDEIQEARDNFQERFTLLEEEFTKLQEDREQHSGTLMQQIAVLEIARDALQEQRDNRDEEIANLVAACDLLKTETETLTVQMAPLADEKKAFGDKSQKVKESLGNEKEKVQGASEEELQKAKEWMQGEIQTIEDASEEKQSAMRKAIDKELQALKARVEELEKLREELEQAKTALEEDNSDLKTKLEAAESGLNTLKTHTAKLESSASDFSTKISGLEEEITNLKTKANGLREQAAGLESDKSGLQEKFEDLEASRLEKQLQLDTLNTKLAGAEAANVALARQKLDRASALSGVQASLDSANAETEALCSSLYSPQLVEAPADYVCSEKLGDIEDAGSAQVLSASLLDILGAFYLRLGGIVSSDAEREVMSFIHKHRRSVNFHSDTKGNSLSVRVVPVILRPCFNFPSHKTAR